MEIKPIETIYNGYRFRSRLEARWAVFFDALGIKYEYEPEGFEMSDGTKYLPDFYLPNDNYYIEVKGMSDHIFSDIKKTEKFVKESKSALMILSDIPFSENANGLYLFPIIYFTGKSGGTTRRERAFFLKTVDPFIQDDFYIGTNRWFSYEPSERLVEQGIDFNKFAYNAIQAINGDLAGVDEPEDFNVRSEFKEWLCDIQSAVIKARQARFEHGETPITGGKAL